VDGWQINYFGDADADGDGDVDVKFVF
jgi:hypothetical protein